MEVVSSIIKGAIGFVLSILLLMGLIKYFDKKILKKTPLLNDLFKKLEESFKLANEDYIKGNIDDNMFFVLLSLIDEIFCEVYNKLNLYEDERERNDYAFITAHKLRAIDLLIKNEDNLLECISEYERDTKKNISKQIKLIRKKMKKNFIALEHGGLNVSDDKKYFSSYLLKDDYENLAPQEMNYFECKSSSKVLYELFCYMRTMYRNDTQFQSCKEEIKQIYEFYNRSIKLCECLYQQNMLKESDYQNWMKIFNHAISYYEKSYFPSFMYGTITGDENDVFKILAQKFVKNFMVSHVFYVHEIVMKYEALAKANGERKYSELFIYNDGNMLYKLYIDDKKYFLITVCKNKVSRIPLVSIDDFFIIYQKSFPDITFRVVDYYIYHCDKLY